jgi:hypothetical protein
MITKATAADVSSLNKLINSAYRGSSQKGWTTDLLEGSRTNEIELIKSFRTINTILKFTENEHINALFLLVEKDSNCIWGC